MTEPRTRIIHFSDVHLEAGFAGASIREFSNKRVVGYLNLTLRRRKLFQEASEKLRALLVFARSNDVDLALCTGDLTALGTAEELRYAAGVLAPFATLPQGWVVIPGNHDVYVEDADASRAFVEGFSSGLIDSRVFTPITSVAEATWPRVRHVDERVSIVTVNSAVPHRSPNDSSGAIGEPALSRLRELLASEALQRRFVIVATHYAPRLASGEPDHDHHGLRDAEVFLEICKSIAFGCIAHGHIHRRYSVRVPGLRVPLCCSGSTTQRGGEGLWLYDVGAHGATATPGRWSDGGYILEPDLAQHWVPQT